MCVFGSVARGEIKPGSDLDVLAVVESLPADVLRRHSEIAPLLLDLKRSKPYRELARLGYRPTVSPVILTPRELEAHPPILLDLVEDAVILGDDGGVLARELGKLRQRLRELGAVRKTGRHGTRYWVLKPDLKPGEVIEL